jgi:ubiquinone/menaquinone biosynthesis C-methylase UbiE
MDPYALNLETWDKIAALYQERFMDLSLYDQSYDAFAGCLPPQPQLLEIGCGPGNVTRQLLARRPDSHIMATDVSPAMISLAQANNPAATCQVLDARHIGLLEASFDGILAGFCLPYLRPEDTRPLLDDAYRLLRLSGHLYISAIDGSMEQSGYRQNSRGDGIFLYYYPKALLRAWMEEAGFEIVTTFDIPYTAGETHIVLICRKTAVSLSRH